jgi:hypothetical protein
MSNWLTRPAYIAAIAFLAGGAIAAAVVLLILTMGGDDDNNGDTNARATSTVESTPGGTPSGTGTPGPTAPSAATTPDDALRAYIRDNLDAEYAGQCSAGQAAGQYCSNDLFRGAELVTLDLGLTSSEYSLEAVLTRNVDGTWIAVAFPLPDPNAPLSVGANAIVYHAADCLNFREAPTTSSAPVTCQLDGTLARVEEGPVTADGIAWWRLEGLGWASAQYLGVAQ